MNDKISSGFKKFFHYFVYLNLITGFFAALYMVFVVYQGPSGFGPLGQDALKISHEFFMQRRMYALEAWMTFGFLSLYFALTTYRK